MMVITCDTMMDFTLVCAAMVREGCTFKADTATLTITLTGGY